MSSLDQYFSGGQYVVLQNHAWVKDPLKMENFNEQVYDLQPFVEF